MTVHNVAPVAVLDGPDDLWINEAGYYNLIDVEDPSIKDTFELRPDRNADGDYDDSGEGWRPLQEMRFIFATACTYTLRAQIRDDDGGIGNVQKVILVRDSGPRLYMTEVKNLFNSADTYQPGYYSLDSKGRISIDVYSNSSGTLYGEAPEYYSQDGAMHFQGRAIIYDTTPVAEQASTIAHELGHGFGLTHDGFKHYLTNNTDRHALMTYSHQFEREHKIGQAVPKLIPWSSTSHDETLTFSPEQVMVLRNATLETNVQGRYMEWDQT